MFVKSLCAQLPKSKIIEMCNLMQACDWERELLVDWLCEPRSKTIESFVYSDHNNYQKRLEEIQKRIENFIHYNPQFIPYNVLFSLLMQSYGIKKK